MKKILLALLAAVVLPLGFAACSSDDDNNDNNNGDETGRHKTTVTNWDDQEYFQNVITDLDTLGNLRGYHFGKVLYKDDPGHLYIGVDSLGEAEKMFRRWLPGDVKLASVTRADGAAAETTVIWVAALTDMDGNDQVTITFATGEGTNVAEVTFSDESAFDYFYQITFMYNSAWPQNDKKSKHWKIGDILYDGYAVNIEDRLDDSDKPLNWVCIRKGGNGTRPIFAAITKHDTYVNGTSIWRPTFYNIRKSRYCPDESMAKTIHSYLTDDYWEIFVAAFNEAGCGKLTEDKDYWINKHTDATDWCYVDYDDTQNYCGDWISEEDPFLLYFDWYDDDEVHDDMSIDADYNNDDDDD